MSKVTILKENKFKNVYVQVRFLWPLEKRKVLSAMVLANMMNEACQAYPTKQSLASALDHLYGASYSASANVIGNAQVLVVKMRTIHPKYIHHEKELIKEQFAFLHEFIFHPYCEDGHFGKALFEEAKRNAITHIKRIQDDPSTYCLYEAMRIAGEGQPFGDGVNMDIDALAKMSLEEVESLYRYIMQEAKCDVLVLGDVEETEIENYANEKLCFTQKEDAIKVDYTLAVKEMEKVQVGYKQISQSYITSLYATHTLHEAETFTALRVANVIFGQIPSSLLFQEVREKNSLCYSIYSSLHPYDGALSISTGVDPKNVEKAMSLIEKQFIRMCEGDFDNSLLDTAKKMLINSLKATNDEVDALFAMAYRNILFNKHETVEDAIQKIEQVSKEQVMDAMKKCTPIVSYVIKEEELCEK